MLAIIFNFEFRLCPYPLEGSVGSIPIGHWRIPARLEVYNHRGRYDTSLKTASLWFVRKYTHAERGEGWFNPTGTTTFITRLLPLPRSSDWAWARDVSRQDSAYIVSQNLVHREEVWRHLETSKSRDMIWPIHCFIGLIDRCAEVVSDHTYLTVYPYLFR